ncbi:MAG: hypothetical protein JXB17_00350 [Bacteroidales bacterium]|nr:hypothetical protein [Bacteroidales bacterium]
MDEKINGLYDDNGNKINPDLLPSPGRIPTLPGLVTLEGLAAQEGLLIK